MLQSPYTQRCEIQSELVMAGEPAEDEFGALLRTWGVQDARTVLEFNGFTSVQRLRDVLELDDLPGLGLPLATRKMMTRLIEHFADKKRMENEALPAEPQSKNGKGNEIEEAGVVVHGDSSGADGYCGGHDGMVAPSDVIVHGLGSVEDMLNVLEDVEKKLDSAANRSPQQTEGTYESTTTRQFKNKNEFEELVQRIKSGNAQVVLRKLFLHQKDSPPTVMQEIWIQDKSNPGAQGPTGDPYKEYTVVHVHLHAAINTKRVQDVDETRHLDVVTAINARHLAPTGPTGHSYRKDNPFFNTYIEPSDGTSLRVYPKDWKCGVCGMSNHPKKQSCSGRGCEGTRPAVWSWEWKKDKSFDEGLAEILEQAVTAFKCQSGSGKSMTRGAGDQPAQFFEVTRTETHGRLLIHLLRPMQVMMSLSLKEKQENTGQPSQLIGDTFGIFKVEHHDILIAFVLPQLDLTTLMNLLFTCKTFVDLEVLDPSFTAARLFMVTCELPRQIRIFNACEDDLKILWQGDSIRDWMRANNGFEDLEYPYFGKQNMENATDLGQDEYTGCESKAVSTFKQEDIQVRTRFVEYFGKQKPDHDSGDSLSWFINRVESELESIRTVVLDNFIADPLIADPLTTHVDEVQDALSTKKYASIGIDCETEGREYSCFDKIQDIVVQRKVATEDLHRRLKDYNNTLLLHTIVRQVIKGDLESVEQLITKFQDGEYKDGHLEMKEVSPTAVSRGGQAKPSGSVERQHALEEKRVWALNMLRRIVQRSPKPNGAISLNVHPKGLRLEELKRQYAESRKKVCPSVEVSQNTKPQHYVKEDGSLLDRPDDAPWPFTILFVGVDNGEKTDPDLNLKKEFENIEQAYRESKVYHGSSRVLIKQLLFSKWNEVLIEIRKEAPTMLQFGCHSQKGKGLELFRQIVDPHDMLDAIRSWNKSGREQNPPRPEIRIIVFNSCDSADHARVLSEVVDFAIGHRDHVVDQDAVQFSRIFFDCIFSCTSLMDSFNQAKSCRKGYQLFSPEQDPRQFYLVHSKSVTASETEPSKDPIVAFLKTKFNERIAERLGAELALFEEDDLRYVKPERLDKLEWLEDVPRAKLLKLCREVTARLMTTDDSDLSGDDTISQGVSIPLAPLVSSPYDTDFESDSEHVLIAARNGGDCAEFQEHMRYFLEDFHENLAFLDPEREIFHVSLGKDSLWGEWTMCMLLWTGFAQSNDATFDKSLRDKWLEVFKEPDQVIFLSTLTECLMHPDTTHPLWTLWMPDFKSCKCQKGNAAGIFFTDRVVQHALRGNEERKDRWKEVVVNDWFNNTADAFPDFLMKANRFLREDLQRSIKGMSIFESVVETQSYVVFMTMSRLTAFLLFGYLEAHKLDLESTAGAAVFGRRWPHGFTSFVSSEGHAVSLSKTGSLSKTASHVIVQGLQCLVHLPQTCWEVMGPVKTAQAFLLQNDHTIELDALVALSLSKKEDLQCHVDSLEESRTRMTVIFGNCGAGKSSGKSFQSFPQFVTSSMHSTLTKPEKKVLTESALQEYTKQDLKTFVDKLRWKITYEDQPQGQGFRARVVLTKGEGDTVELEWSDTKQNKKKAQQAAAEIFLAYCHQQPLTLLLLGNIRDFQVDLKTLVDKLGWEMKYAEDEDASKPLSERFRARVVLTNAEEGTVELEWSEAKQNKKHAQKSAAEIGFAYFQKQTLTLLLRQSTDVD